MSQQDTSAIPSAAPSQGGGSRSFQRRQQQPAADRAQELLQRRVPPHSEEAEQAVLSGVFLRQDLLHEIIDLFLTPCLGAVKVKLADKNDVDLGDLADLFDSGPVGFLRSGAQAHLRRVRFAFPAERGRGHRDGL